MPKIQKLILGIAEILSLMKDNVGGVKNECGHLVDYNEYN
jgi:hypothetical protein